MVPHRRRGRAGRLQRQPCAPFPVWGSGEERAQRLYRLHPVAGAHRARALPHRFHEQQRLRPERGVGVQLQFAHGGMRQEPPGRRARRGTLHLLRGRLPAARRPPRAAPPDLGLRLRLRALPSGGRAGRSQRRAPAGPRCGEPPRALPLAPGRSGGQAHGLLQRPRGAAAHGEGAARQLLGAHLAVSRAPRGPLRAARRAQGGSAARRGGSLCAAVRQGCQSHFEGSGVARGFPRLLAAHRGRGRQRPRVRQQVAPTQPQAARRKQRMAGRRSHVALSGSCTGGI
mmetsp:Transcript_72257/g.224138  ORF Transcript_72257/g.224138 Transcript_72257/m.224138 type:complete len:285 (+) Transcript_72257:357-1211(+)